MFVTHEQGFQQKIETRKINHNTEILPWSQIIKTNYDKNSNYLILEFCKYAQTNKELSKLN